jgi:hypothetical protein
LRLVTGLLAGISLGVGLAWLLNVSLWPASAPLLRGHDGLIWMAGLGMASGLLLSGASWALVPMTFLLLTGALLALLVLNLALLGTAYGAAGIDRSGANAAPTPGGWRLAARPATLALTLALVEMASLAGGRYALEAAVSGGLR